VAANVIHYFGVEDGDVEAAFAAADHVVENHTTGMAQCADGAARGVADVDIYGNVVVWSTPDAVHGQIGCPAARIPATRSR
jgi:hypothetical protein